MERYGMIVMKCDVERERGVGERRGVRQERKDQQNNKEATQTHLLQYLYTIKYIISIYLIKLENIKRFNIIIYYYKMKLV